MNQILGQQMMIIMTAAGGPRFLGFDAAWITGVGFNIINILILAYILYRVLYGPVKKYLADRAARVQAQINDAETMFKDAEGYKEEYSNKLSCVDAERATILDSVKKRALTDEAAIIKKANEQAEQLKARAYSDIEREKEKAQHEMKKHIIDLSSMLTLRYISTTINEEHQNKLVDEIIDEMRAAKWQS
ncbi:MAG: F0F1 ATP synthase subunit B [Defluviitaleaceae bacterium]|nr:F0F1 ATP synthase subunit B [Defluviitaleaceae bacterium]